MLWQSQRKYPYLIIFKKLKHFFKESWSGSSKAKTSVADPNPDPPDPHVFGPPGSGSFRQRYVFGSGSFYHQAKENKKNLDSYCFVTSF
jgi:hypothetical protein